MSRIIAETRKLSKQSDKTRLSRDIIKDFMWWDKFIDVFYGVELIPPVGVSLAIYGDACPQSGGSWNQISREYFSMRFPINICTAAIPIHVKEFLVVILSVRLCGPNWTGLRVMIFCANDAVCDAITNQKPKDPTMQQLITEVTDKVISPWFH